MLSRNAEEFKVSRCSMCNRYVQLKEIFSPVYQSIVLTRGEMITIRRNNIINIVPE